MILSTSSIYTIMLFSALLACMLNYKHLLVTLLALELMMLLLILLLFIKLSTHQLPLPPILVLLTFSACEASLGLALLVAIIRSAGNDNVKLTTLTSS